MNSIERLLTNLDNAPWDAISRVALGLCIPPVIHALSGGSAGVWLSLAIFAGMLFLVRMVPAVLRHALPFSAEAKEIWADRRAIAKRFDSYQWQKLFWIGIGLLPYAAAGGMGAGETVVTWICLIGGGAGLVFWRGINAVGGTR